MLDYKGRVRQTIMFLLVLIFEWTLVILMHRNIIPIDFICMDMVNLTMLFMVIVQLLWLNGWNKSAMIVCHLYFIIMCILFYYSNTLLSLITYVVNILVLVCTMIIRIKHSKYIEEEE